MEECMRKGLLMMCTIVLVAGLVSCGTKKPSDVLMKARDASGAGDTSMIEQYYTAETSKMIRELEEMSKKFPGAKSKPSKGLAADAKWEVVKEDIEGDTAQVTIRYTEHPVARLKGTEYTFRMKREGGDWKIDMEKELAMAVKMMKAMSAPGGLMDQLKKMGK